MSLTMLLSMLFMFVYADNSVTAAKTASRVLVDGEEKLFDAYNINGNNYFKQRDIAFVLSGSASQFVVTWDGKKNAINLISQKPYTVVGSEMLSSKGQTTKTVLINTAVRTDDPEIQEAVSCGFVPKEIQGNWNYIAQQVGIKIDNGFDWDYEKYFPDFYAGNPKS